MSVEFINGQFLVRRKKVTAVDVPKDCEVLYNAELRMFKVRRFVKTPTAERPDAFVERGVHISEDDVDAARIRSWIATLVRS